MASKKAPGSKKKTGRKRAAPRAPGKSDPQFLSRLSRAIEEEFASPQVPRNAAAGVSPEPARNPARPSENRAAVTPPAAGKKAGSPADREKPAGKPSRAATTRKGSKDRRTLLVRELTDLLKELDEEGLDFLLEQAHVHRYNMEVERLNEAEERRTASRPEAKGKAVSRAAPRPPSLRIERSQDGNTYHVVSGGRYKMFSAEEMLALVRIAHANPDGFEAGRGLHRWMVRERMDAISDLGISGPSDPSLSVLAGILRTSFAKPAPRR